LIKPQGPWRTVDQVEVATLEWVDWLPHRRLYEHRDDLPPSEYEAPYYRQHRTQPAAESSNQQVTRLTGAIQAALNAFEITFDGRLSAGRN
jgi:hypothetical protein